ncbi:unnamed protein product [Moneuplotes crassus]|uniref:Protein kinase domain-containing protein n=1 Tax=Euplotes crassus TaxID=5936 RepID=A0AAD1XBW1_EUPCR|nr:unnamed protein product [Moneuplotes crassus]
MKSRGADSESRKNRRQSKNKGSFSSKDNIPKTKTLHRRLKSEERTTSVYLNPNQNKNKKIAHDRSASNRMGFKNEFDDYSQVATSRKNRKGSKKQKPEGTLPFVGNNSFGGYTSGINPVFSMLSSLNNSAVILGNEQSSTLDKSIQGTHQKQNNSVMGPGGLKGTTFSGMKTTMLNYVKDLDYMMPNESHKASLQMNSDKMHNYSVNLHNQKSASKKPLILTTQKSAKRRSVDRDPSKNKHKRSSSDGTRIVSSKRKKKEQTKSPSTNSAYYNKMIAAFGNAGKYPTKTIRKVVKQNGKLYSQGAAILSKKRGKDIGNNKLSNYYDHNNSKSNDARQKSTNIRSLPLSLMNSFEKRGKEKQIMKKKKEHSVQNYKKVPNQVFYHKGKVNVSGQHLKFSKPKSKGNVSQHSENQTHQFSNSLAFSGGNTPISPPFYQDMNAHTLVKDRKPDGLPYTLFPQNCQGNAGSGMSYDNKGMKYPYPTFVQRPETNVNVYDEEMAFLSSGDHTKQSSFYKDANNSFTSQTYDNKSKKTNINREAIHGYSYSNDQGSKKRVIMDKKTKMSKISEIMGYKDATKKTKTKQKRQSKTGFQNSRKSSKYEDEPLIPENPNAGDNVTDFKNNKEELIQFLHDKDLNQISVDQPSLNFVEFKDHPGRDAPKAKKKFVTKGGKSKVMEYITGDKKAEEKKYFSKQNSPRSKIHKVKPNKGQLKPQDEDNKDSSVNSAQIVEIIKASFLKNTPPQTNVDFYRAGKILGKGAFGKVSLALHKLAKKLVALKLLNKELIKSDSSKDKVMQEVKILKRFRHPNVVKLYETFESDKHIVVVMELCAGGDLLNYVRKRRRLKETYAKYIFKQIIEGIAHVHSKGILHRDIKLDNILLDGKGIIKIADFGVSRIVKNIEDKMTEQCGTPAYIAPEILRDNGYYGFACDLWSAGVVLYAMLYGTVPFKANNMQDLHKLIMKSKYSLKDDISEEARDLLKCLLERDPTKRFTVMDIMAHEWMEGIEENMVLFNDQETQLIRNEFTFNNTKRYNRNTKNANLESDRSRNTEMTELISDCFTEQRLDSCEDELLKNVSTKSIILAPFNSTKTHLSDKLHESVEDNIFEKWNVLKFDVKCRELDKEYERNFNDEVDNGVYNKFVNNSIRNDEDGEKANEELISHPSTFMEASSNDDYIKQLNKVFGKGKKGDRNKDFGKIETMVSNYNFKINQEIIKSMNQRYEYPIDYIVKCLDSNETNYCTTTYYLLLVDQNY